MATKYSFSISEDFLNSAICSTKLHGEIEGSNIDTTSSFFAVNTEGNACDIWFENELTPSEQTVLNNLVAAHDGVPCSPFSCAFLSSENSSLTSSVSYIQRDSISLENIEAGEYEIKWYFEYSYSDNVTKPKFRVQLDDETTLAEFGYTLYVGDDEWISKSGFAFVILEQGDHNIDIDYGAGLSNKTTRIRRVRISIEKISGIHTRTIRELEHIEAVDIML